MTAQLHHFTSAYALHNHLLEATEKAEKVYLQVFWYEKMFSILGGISGDVNKFKDVCASLRRALCVKNITVDFNGKNNVFECEGFTIDGRSTDFVVFTFEFDETLALAIFERMIAVNADGGNMMAIIDYFGN